MCDNENTRREEAELEREIRQGRKFTLEEAVARMVGPGAMKGESPISRLQQAEIEIGSWLGTHLLDSARGLEIVLHRRVKESEILLKHLDQPLAALSSCLQRILDADFLLRELVREADVEWGRQMCERPYFEKEGLPANPDDPYTVESVRKKLSELLEQLTSS